MVVQIVGDNTIVWKVEQNHVFHPSLRKLAIKCLLACCLSQPILKSKSNLQTCQKVCVRFLIENTHKQCMKNMLVECN